MSCLVENSSTYALQLDIILKNMLREERIFPLIMLYLVKYYSFLICF